MADHAATLVVFCALMTLAASSGTIFIARAQISEAQILSAQARLSSVAYRAERGTWAPTRLVAQHQALGPHAGTRLPGVEGSYVASVWIHDDGAIDVDFKTTDEYRQIAAEIRGKTLSLRPVSARAISGAPIAWHCGPASTDPRRRVFGRDRTSVSLGVLLRPCRL
ncbi:MAG: pilin [Pseudomonadota bacterium]